MFNKLYEKVKLFILENIKFLLILATLVFLFTFELPFVVYTPGGIVNLDKRIEVEGSNKKDGTLNMSYVTLRKGNIPSILLSFVIPNWDLLSKDEVTSKKTVDELLELEKLYMKSSIDYATILAYEKSGKEINIKNTINNVTYILEDAKTDIQLYDEVISVDGNYIKDIKSLKEYVNTKSVGDKLKFKVKRNGKEKIVESEVISVDNELLVGITFLTTYEYSTNPEIDITVKSSESGSSGGLMLSLAIYNSLVNEDITGGQKVVGTGTIDIDGNVGEIDGIKYKLLGAQKNNADIFLCPYENYEEAISVKEKYNLKLKIKKVSTFDEALNVLKNTHEEK